MSQSPNLLAQPSQSPKPPIRRKTPKSPGAPTTAPLYNALQLIELVETLRKLGVTKFSQGGLHIELAHVGPPLSKPDDVPAIIAGPPQLGPINQEISDEDMLFWSSDPMGPSKEPVK